jgi:hypothetical protein
VTGAGDHQNAVTGILPSPSGMAARRGRSRPPARWRALAGLAAGGVVLGHLLAYVLAFPDDHERHEHLAATGHGSFQLLGLLTLAVAGVCPVVLGAWALRDGGGFPLRSAALLLGCLQVPAFLLLELVERHLDLPLTLTDRGVLAGLVLQVVVALAITILLRAFVRAVQLTARLLRRRRRAPARIRPHAPAILLPAGAELHVGTRRRAPPAPVLR